MKSTTRDACEKKYIAASELYRKYLDELSKSKFTTHTAAAKAVKRSRAHLHDCITGKRGLDSVRRLVDKMENAEPV